jgi:hypothetical protein
VLNHESCRLLIFRLGHRHEVVEELPENALRELERYARGKSSAAVFISSAMRARASHERKLCGCRSRLHTDDAATRVDRLCNETRSGGAASTAHRHDDCLDVILEDLQRMGCYPGDQERFVAGADVPIAVLLRKTLAVSRASSKPRP